MPADVDVDYYVKTFRVSREEATRRLSNMDAVVAAHAAIKERLGDAYASVWYDNTSGRMQVGVVRGASKATINDTVRAFDLSDVTDLVPVESTWDDLTRAHAQVVERFHLLLRSQELQVAISTPDNAVHVTVAPSVSNDVRQQIKSFATEPKVAIVLAEAPKDFFEVPEVACFYPNCTAPLRAGVEINFNIVGWPRCTSGFVVGLPGGPSGTQYAILTAGHCVNAWTGWTLYATQPYSGAWGIGPAAFNHVGADGDDAVVAVGPTSNWLTPTPPEGRVAGWSFDHEWPVWFTGPTTTGVPIGRAGATTPHAGGITTLYYVTRFNGLVDVGALVQTTSCADPGDSGGPVWSGHTAMGIAVIARSCASSDPLMWYSEVTRALARYGGWIVTA